MTSIYEAIRNELKSLRADYPAEVIEAFTLEGTLHWERYNFTQAWFGIRETSTVVAGVYLDDLNFSLENSQPGDQPSRWIVKHFVGINKAYSSSEEYNWELRQAGGNQELCKTLEALLLKQVRRGLELVAEGNGWAKALERRQAFITYSVDDSVVTAMLVSRRDRSERFILELEFNID